jgi:hypothetical protein
MAANWAGAIASGSEVQKNKEGKRWKRMTGWMSSVLHLRWELAEHKNEIGLLQMEIHVPVEWSSCIVPGADEWISFNFLCSFSQIYVQKLGMKIDMFVLLAWGEKEKKLRKMHAVI